MSKKASSEILTKAKEYLSQHCHIISRITSFQDEWIQQQAATMKGKCPWSLLRCSAPDLKAEVLVRHLLHLHNRNVCESCAWESPEPFCSGADQYFSHICTNIITWSGTHYFQNSKSRQTGIWICLSRKVNCPMLPKQNNPPIFPNTQMSMDSFDWYPTYSKWGQSVHFSSVCTPWSRAASAQQAIMSCCSIKWIHPFWIIWKFRPTEPSRFWAFTPKKEASLCTAMRHLGNRGGSRWCKELSADTLMRLYCNRTCLCHARPVHLPH